MRLQPGQCAICRKAEQGAGYYLGRGKAIWFCNEDVGMGDQYRAAQRHGLIAAIERKALLAAGDKAGQWLDDLGKTDLATLDAVEWQGFLETFMESYGHAMRAELGAR